MIGSAASDISIETRSALACYRYAAREVALQRGLSASRRLLVGEGVTLSNIALAMIDIPYELHIGSDHPLFYYYYDLMVFAATSEMAGRLFRTPHIPLIPEATGHFYGVESGLEVYFYLDGVFEAAMKGSPPEQIKLIIREKEDPGPPQFKTAGFESLSLRVHLALFALLFDRWHDWLKDNKMTDYGAWPPVAAFCRMVRNAAVHGGTLNMSANSPHKAAWRGLHYDASSRGRTVWGNDLGPADLIVLMIELTDEMEELRVKNGWTPLS